MTQEEDQRLQLESNEHVQNIAIDLIKPNPYQPRKTFDEEKLQDLAKSIEQHGILQPIVLRKQSKGSILWWVNEDSEHLKSLD